MDESKRRLARRVAQAGGFVVLRNLVHLRVTGSDAERFLNGQLSNRLPADSRKLPACLTNAKGKLEAFVQVSRTRDGFHLDADALLQESLQARLDRYIISDDVQIEEVSAQVVLVHFLPPSGAAFPDMKQLELYEKFRCGRFGVPGLDVVVPVADLAQVVAALTQTHASLEDWLIESLRIENGVPVWGKELDGTVLPPEAGLDRMAIDYHKGCYIGQEVISRIKSVGHVNRNLCLLTSEYVLQPGTLLTEPGTGKEAGHVTSSTYSFNLDKAVSLGYVKRSWILQGTLLSISSTRETTEKGTADNAFQVTVESLPS